MATTLTGPTPVPAAPASAASAGEGALRIVIVTDGWAGRFAPAELASALRLRMPRAEVSVAAAAPGDRRRGSLRVRWLGESYGLRVERGDGDAVEFPLSDGGAELEPPKAARRAALLVALFAEGGEPLGESAPLALSPHVEPPGTTAPPRRARADRWVLGAQMGPAFALSDDGTAVAVALTVKAKRYVSPATAIEIGAKLSDEYPASLASQSAGVADRAFFAGAAHDVELARRWTVDLEAALQYTYPVVDLDRGPVTRLEAPVSSRFAVRVGSGLVWSPASHVDVGVSAATSFAFQEREFQDGAGNDVLNLGSLTLDLTAGASVRW